MDVPASYLRGYAYEDPYIGERGPDYLGQNDSDENGTYIDGLPQDRSTLLASQPAAYTIYAQEIEVDPARPEHATTGSLGMACVPVEGILGNSERKFL